MFNVPPTAPKLTSSNPKPKTTAQRGYGADHRKLRRQVFAEQRFVCDHCRADVCTDLHHIDHDPHNTERSNVVGVCKACHFRVHRKEG